MASREAKMDEL
jgi:solute carrier family 36 (proton-coupled amino acid transporter)